MTSRWLPFEGIVALRFLREGRMQTLFIVAGIAIGVAVIVFMSALLNGLQTNFVRRVLSGQAHIQLLPAALKPFRARYPQVQLHLIEGWYPTLEGFITGGPVVAAVLEGLEAIRVVREMLGATSGLKAAPGTIRGDFSSSRQMNLVHGSDGLESAAREIALYFRDDEIVAGELHLRPWLRAADEA